MKIRIHPLFLVYLSMMIWLSSWKTCVCAFAALFIHELAHYAAAIAFHERITRIRITPFGGIMDYAQGTVSSKGVRGFLIAASGPAANYLCIAAFMLPAIQKTLDPLTIRQLITANFAMMILNLLPALPLDGGRMLFCLGYYFLRTAPLIAILSLSGVIAGIFLSGLAIYGLLVYKVLNCSILLIGIYLTICAWKCRREMYMECMYTVVHERMQRREAMHMLSFIKVSRDSSLYSLLEPMMRTQACCFVYTDHSGELHAVDEQKFCEALLHSSASCIREIQ